jgi:ornithine carbamoyltransferase
MQTENKREEKRERRDYKVTLNPTEVSTSSSSASTSTSFHSTLGEEEGGGGQGEEEDPKIEYRLKSEQSSRAYPVSGLLSLGELSPREFYSLLDLAEEFKRERKSRKLFHQLPGCSLALIFEKPSTRTRVSFEVAIFELGGHAIVLNSHELQISRGESVEDTARVLSQYCHAIAARVHSHETLVRLSQSANIPVINALSDLYHPCQTVADIQTIRQYKGKLEGLKVAWVGDGNNVCNSLLIGSALSGMNMTVACPRNHAPFPEALSKARALARITNSSIDVVEDPKEAVIDADVVVTDTFVSMGQDSERVERLSEFLPDYQVNDSLMALAKPDAIFMHCLPAHRGEEVSSSVIDGERSVVWREAENRLHSQKAILYHLICEKFSSPGKI